MVTAAESVINVLEHFDQKEGEARDRFETALKCLVVVLGPKELKFRVTGRRVRVVDLPKLNGRATSTVNLSMMRSEERRWKLVLKVERLQSEHKPRSWI